MLTESDILYQNGNFWVMKNQEKGCYKTYIVFEVKNTHSIEKNFTCLKGNAGLEKAIKICNNYANTLT